MRLRPGSSTPVTRIAAGERLGELGDERDRAADADLDRLGAPGLAERGAGRVVGRAGASIAYGWPTCRT